LPEKIRAWERNKSAGSRGKWRAKREKIVNRNDSLIDVKVIRAGGDHRVSQRSLGRRGRETTSMNGRIPLSRKKRQREENGRKHAGENQLERQEEGGRKKSYGEEGKMVQTLFSEGEKKLFTFLSGWKGC